jgi:uncharacterized protein (DUF4415 family)
MIGRYGDMKNSRRNKSPKLVRLGRKEDRAVTAAAASDPDNPDLTDADFARMRPAIAVMPNLVRLAQRARGPQKAPTKQLVSLRLDRDVLAHFRRYGRGWQSRINTTLRKAARLPKSAQS